MTRMAQPRPGEAIWLVPTSKGVPRYRAVVSVGPRVNGKRKQKTATFATLKQARAFRAEMTAQTAAGTYVAPTSETVAEVCARWVASRTDVRQVTREGYANVLAPVLRRIGPVKVQALSLADVQALVAWLAREGGRRGQPLGPRSVRAAMVALGQALDVSVAEGTVPRNVARLVKRPRLRIPVGRDLEHWQAEEVDRFREVADADPLAAAWRLSLAGCRRSEVMGVRWSDVDTSTGVVKVTQARVALDHGDTTDDPKSAQSRREIPVEVIEPGTAALLRALRAEQVSHPLLGLGYVERGLVVTDALGKPMRPEAYSDRFRVLCVEAGVPVIRLHSLRHTLALALDRAGVSPNDAAALLGHTTEVFLSTYLPTAGTSGIVRAAEALGRVAAAE